MLVFDLVAGLVITGVVLAVLFIGIAQSGRYQAELEVQRDRGVVTPGRFGQEELDEAVRRVVRTRRDERRAA
ncbi:hypothetical protein GHK86_18710 [Acidimicrobiaceae bacterium USS-CC1]|uniref:Uncharacterized protein n=1 Tax=Acidiferrimicrobium australe TaxID=2664430 RepID=A0ABW9QYU8_9ACTN|nr:hypothetical protein [Acidiferrimicrobium australe]